MNILLKSYPHVLMSNEFDCDEVVGLCIKWIAKYFNENEFGSVFDLYENTSGAPVILVTILEDLSSKNILNKVDGGYRRSANFENWFNINRKDLFLTSIDLKSCFTIEAEAPPEEKDFLRDLKEFLDR